MAASQSPHKTRPFYLGCSRWPSDISIEALITLEKFIKQHTDIVLIHCDGGIPWPEAFKGKPFSEDVNRTLNYKGPKNHKVFLAITPLNFERNAIAPYWGEKDNLPLPSPWNKYALNSPEIKKAYLNYARHAIKTVNPDYLSIGTEVNILLQKNKPLWKQYKDLHRSTYMALKTEYPNLPIFFTIDMLRVLGFAENSDPERQLSELHSLMDVCDIFAMSFYPYMTYDIKKPYRDELFDVALSFGKPIAISETGYTSRDFKTLGVSIVGNETLQEEWIKFVLEKAYDDNYVFVINWASTDFEKLLEKIPPEVRVFAAIWAYTGLQESNGKPKKTLRIWDSYLKILHE